MELIESTEHKREVSEEAKTSLNCGTPFGSYKVGIDKRFREKIYLTLVSVVVIAVGFGFIHVIRGPNLDLPFHIAFKDLFGYSETFINIDKITGMPWIAAKSKYPIGCKVLQEKGYIELDEQFEKRVKREFEEDLKKAQAEFMEEFEKMLKKK